MQLHGSTFIITGGSSGLGAATARAFHARGARVVLADLNAELGEPLAGELGSASLFCRTDVTSEDEARAVIDLTRERFGAVNGLINCAGIGPAERVVGKRGPHRLETFSKVIQVNLIGAFNMIRLAAAAMATAAPTSSGERGVIINTASVAVWDGQIGQAAYSASKGGVVAMTLPLARELASSGIRICTIAPGLFQTPMMATLPPDIQESLGKSVPFPQRLGRPEEYAALAQHIVENEMLNGETIRLDGALRLPPR
jgi:NAD(P)-dependent dehydrogenase (short-subunit alcohol dehydrogenase family)